MALILLAIKQKDLKQMAADPEVNLKWLTPVTLVMLMGNKSPASFAVKSMRLKQKTGEN